MVVELQVVPDREWHCIALVNFGRAYRYPHTLDREIRIRDHPLDIRQIAIKDLGHEMSTLLPTNRFGETAARLVDRHARRMFVESDVTDAIDFFHMDALPAGVPIEIDLDIQLTPMASGPYRVLATRAGIGFESARARTLFRNFVRASADIRITGHEAIVSFGRRLHNLCWFAPDYARNAGPTPWLQNRSLQRRFS